MLRSPAILLAALSLSCASGPPTFGRSRANESSDTLYFVNGAEPESLDPALATGQPAGRIVSALFDGLTEYDPRDLSPLPGAAASWTVHPDGRGYTFHLRPEARWSDGTPLTAGDFAWSWRRMLGPESTGTNASHLYVIENARLFHQGRLYVLTEEVQGIPAGTDVEVTRSFAGVLARDAQARRFPAEESWLDVLPRGTQVVVVDEQGDNTRVRFCPDQGSGHPPAWSCPQDPQMGWVPASAIQEILPHVQDAQGADLLHFEVRPVHPRPAMGEPDDDMPLGVGGPYLLVPARDLRLDPDRVGIHVTDDHTLEIRLEGAAPYFLQQTSHSALRAVPRQAISQWADDWTRPEHIVTSGPFRLAEHRPDERIVLERDDAWWGASEVALRRVVAWTVGDLPTAVNLYRAGDSDLVLANELPTEFVPEMVNQADFHASPGLGVYLFRLNTQKPPLDDPRIRRALGLAIDRNELVRVLHDTVRPASHLVPPEVAGPERPEGTGFDPEQARALLASAGYDASGEPITLLFNERSDHRMVAEAVREQWRRELGLDVRLEGVDWSRWLKATRSLDYQVSRGAWVADFVDATSFLDLWSTADSHNRTGWSSSSYDAILEQAAREPDVEMRALLLQEAERILEAEMPVIPVFWYRWVELTEPTVRGWYPNLLDKHPLRFVSLER